MSKLLVRNSEYRGSTSNVPSVCLREAVHWMDPRWRYDIVEAFLERPSQIQILDDRSPLGTPRCRLRHQSMARARFVISAQRRSYQMRIRMNRIFMRESSCISSDRCEWVAKFRKGRVGGWGRNNLSTELGTSCNGTSSCGRPAETEGRDTEPAAAAEAALYAFSRESSIHFGCGWMRSVVGCSGTVDT